MADTPILLDEARPRLTVGTAMDVFLCAAMMAAQRLGATDHEISSYMVMYANVGLDGSPSCHEVACAANRRLVTTAAIREALVTAYAHSQQRLVDVP